MDFDSDLCWLSARTRERVGFDFKERKLGVLRSDCCREGRKNGFLSLNLSFECYSGERRLDF